MKTNGTRSKPRLLAFGTLAALAVTVAYPVCYLVVTSLRPNSDYIRAPMGWPQEWTLANFRVVWVNYGASTAFFNSLYVVVVSLVITLLLATFAGYSLAKLHPPGGRAISRTFVSVMLIPSQVLILPIYLMLSRMQLVGEHFGLMLLFIATNIPISTYFMTIAFRALPDEVLEAARIDGAGFFRSVRSVALPICLPHLTTLGVLQFMAMWNELLFAYILLPEETKRLLTPALARIADGYLAEQPLIAAGLLLGASLPLILLSLTSRYLISGASAGISR